MKAVRFGQFGKLDVLAVEDVPTLSAGSDQALVRVKAALINPSDVKNVQGMMSQTTLPRTPWRDFAGVVEAGPPDWVGAAVWGTGGDTGFTRDGSHAEQIVVPAASLRRKPAALDLDQTASVGVNFVAAWTSADRSAVRAVGCGGGVPSGRG